MAKTLEAARLKTRLTLEQAIAAPDKQGGETITFTPVAILWAEIEPVEAIVAERGGRSVCLTRHRLTIRARGDIAPGMRLVRPGRVLAVKAVLSAEGGRFMTIDAEEETS